MLLEKYLKEKNITQKKFASLIKISQVHMNRLIKGRRTPSLRVVKRIEKITGGLVTADDFETEDLNDFNLLVMGG